MRKFAKSIGSGGQNARGVSLSCVQLLHAYRSSGRGEHVVISHGFEALLLSSYVADPELLTKGNPTV